MIKAYVNDKMSQLKPKAMLGVALLMFVEG